MRFFSQGIGSPLRLLTDYEYFRTEQRPGLDAEALSLYGDAIGFAYFAANLGWDYATYAAHTPVQLMFVRKEIENKVVRDSSLLRDAVQVAVNNCLSKRKAKLWQRLAGELDEPPVPFEEIEATRELMARKAPWTPWQRGGGDG